METGGLEGLTSLDSLCSSVDGISKSSSKEMSGASTAGGWLAAGLLAGGGGASLGVILSSVISLASCASSSVIAGVFTGGARIRSFRFVNKNRQNKQILILIQKI